MDGSLENCGVANDIVGRKMVNVTIVYEANNIKVLRAQHEKLYKQSVRKNYFGRKAYEYSIPPFKYFSNLKTTKSSKPPVPKNKLNLVNSLVAAAPHLHVPEGPVEAPTSSNSVVVNPATDSAVDNTATDSSSVST
ncbi:hypothetical protein LXL04_031991 [Taraxacum kok-saghyz]